MDSFLLLTLSILSQNIIEKNPAKYDKRDFTGKVCVISELPDA